MNRIYRLVLAVLCCAVSLSGCAAPQDAALPQPVDAPTPAPANGAPSAGALSGLSVTFFNCGKADSALLTAGGLNILIDTGTQKAGKYVLSRLKEMGVSRLDAMIITHPHKDHIGGADLILEKIPADRVYIGPLALDSKQTRQFDEALRACALTPRTLQADDTFSFGDMRFEVLGPRRTSYEDENDLSLVLMLTYGETRFLFPADAEKPLLSELLLSGKPLGAQVLKVPHHGGKEDNSALFLQAVSPQIAVIPCERGTEDNLPDEPVLSALRSLRADVFITDDGDVTVTSDGINVSARQ